MNPLTQEWGCESPTLMPSGPSPTCSASSGPNSRIIEATAEIAPRAWRRQLHLMLDAIRAGHTHELPEPAVTDDQLYQAMARLSQ